MKIIIPGPPIAKERHRCGCRNRKPFAYDPQSKGEMARVRQYILHAWNGAFESQDQAIQLEASNLAKAESFSLTLIFALPTNDRISNSKRNAKLWGFDAHIKRPDLDNLEKFYMDCATNVIWDDDAHVNFLSSFKIDDENPHTQMIIKVNDMKMNPQAREILKLFSPDELKEFSISLKEAWFPVEAIDNARYERNPSEKYLELASIANQILEFSVKYADKLKKVKKFQDIPGSDIVKSIFDSVINTGLPRDI